MVVGAHISQNCNDRREIDPALAGLSKVAVTVGRAERLLADAGYFSRANVEACEAAGVEFSIAQGRERHSRCLVRNPAEPEACPADADAVERMRRRMGTCEGKAIYGKRKATVETVFGIIKEALGFR